MKVPKEGHLNTSTLKITSYKSLSRVIGKGREKEIKMKEIKTTVETIVESIRTLEKERDEMENALYLARLLKEDLFSLGRVRYVEFPWVEGSAPTRHNYGLRLAVSIFNEISEESETLVYYAGCGCCSMSVWAKEIANSSAKKVILICDKDALKGYNQRYLFQLFEPIKKKGIDLVYVSIDLKNKEASK